MLNENSPKKDLLEVAKAVVWYCESNQRSKEYRKAVKQGKSEFELRVNTPEKYPALYIYHIGRLMVHYQPILLLEGSEGESYCLLSSPIRRKGGYWYDESLIVLHGHAINRYIERRKFDGTYEQARRGILNHLCVMSVYPDSMDETFYLNYDGGSFLCNKVEGVLHLRTYIVNRQHYPEQRLRSMQSEEDTRLFRQELEEQESEIFGLNI